MISIAGNFDEEEFISRIEEKFKDWVNKAAENVHIESNYQRKVVGINKDLEQVHVHRKQNLWTAR